MVEEALDFIMEAWDALWPKQEVQGLPPGGTSMSHPVNKMALTRGSQVPMSVC